MILVESFIRTYVCTQCSVVIDLQTGANDRDATSAEEQPLPAGDGGGAVAAEGALHLQDGPAHHGAVRPGGERAHPEQLPRLRRLQTAAAGVRRREETYHVPRWLPHHARMVSLEPERHGLLQGGQTAEITHEAGAQD